MKKAIVVFLACAVFLLSLAGCANTYNEGDFIGKTSAQIETEFGPFDCIGSSASADGAYRNTACGYTIREPRVGFLGTDPEWLFFICFDENGIAYDTFEDYRPGG